MEEIVIHSSVNAALLQTAVWRGSLLAAVGAFIILFSGIFMPVQQLDFWGFFLFCIAFGFITAGLLPYRRLRALESSPYCLKVTLQQVVLSRKGRILLTIPLNNIDTVSFVQKNSVYGIEITLKSRKNRDAGRFSRPFLNLSKLTSKKEYDLFLPYFSNRGYRQLEEIILNSSV